MADESFICTFFFENREERGCLSVKLIIILQTGQSLAMNTPPTLAQIVRRKFYLCSKTTKNQN